MTDNLSTTLNIPWFIKFIFHAHEQSIGQSEAVYTYHWQSIIETNADEPRATEGYG